jgi:hypothetical protein
MFEEMLKQPMFGNPFYPMPNFGWWAQGCAKTTYVW